MAERASQHDGKTQLPALTGVRALAALMVLALHAGQNFPQFFTDNAFVQHGYLGVDLFFVLSGFIIAHVYLYALVSASGKALRVFFWHRFVRLFPTHATVLLILMALVIAMRSFGIELNEPQNWSNRDLPWHFLMVHAWGTVDVAGWNAPSWSISAEWFAYLLFPAIAAGTLALPRRAALPLAFATLLIAAVIFYVEQWTIEWAWLGPPALLRVASEFICGVLLYRATRIDSTGLSPRLSDLLTFGGLVGLCTGAFLTVNDFVLVGFLAVLITGASGPGAGVRAVFGCRPVVWLGEISYSIYLVHFLVLLILRHGVDHIAAARIAASEAMRLMMFVVSIGSVIGAAALLFYLVEYPARTRLRNLLGKIDAQPSRPDTMATRNDARIKATY
jgi:peptidoglycan/LPS O-acetylase OafA/YrhL